MNARCFALIPAAGVGSRAGGTVPKQYRSVAGKPMIVHTLAAFASLPAIERVIVVISPTDQWFDRLALDETLAARVDLVRAGGATRDSSVAAGLAAMRDVLDADDWVLVHDAARCGITPDLITLLIASLTGKGYPAAVGGLLALPLDDTVKREAAGDATLVASVSETVDRRGLWRAQTPQMFRHRMLAAALADAHARGDSVTDESSAMEAGGHRVLLVPGSPRNFKVTTAEDLAMMDALMRAGR